MSASISGSDELFSVAFDTFHSDINVYSENGIRILQLLLAVLYKGKYDARASKSALDEKNVVDNSLIKKIIDLPVGSDLIAFMLCENKMYKFAKILYEHSETPYVLLTNSDDAASQNDFIVIFARENISIVNSALRSCSLTLDTKETILIPSGIVQGIREQYTLFTEENSLQLKREKAIQQSKINKIEEIKNLTGDVGLSALEIERILSESYEIINELKMPSYNKKLSREGLRNNSEDFLQHLVELAQIQGSTIKLDSKSLPKNIQDDKKRKKSVIYKTNRIEFWVDSPIPQLTTMMMENKLPFLPKPVIASDYLIDASVLPTSIVNRFDNHEMLKGHYLAVNKENLNDLFESVFDAKEDDLSLETLCNHLISGDKKTFRTEALLFNIFVKAKEEGRKTYQERFKDARDVNEKLHELSGDSQKDKISRKKLVQEVLGSI